MNHLSVTRVVDLSVNVIFIIQKKKQISSLFSTFSRLCALLLASLQLKHHLPMMAFICPVSLGENIVTLEDRNYKQLCVSVIALTKKTRTASKEQDSILNTFNIVDCSFCQLQMMFSGVLWEGYDKS